MAKFYLRVTAAKHNRPAGAYEESEVTGLYSDNRKREAVSLDKQTLPMTPNPLCPDSNHSADAWPDIREEALGAKPSSSPKAALHQLSVHCFSTSDLILHTDC